MQKKVIILVMALILFTGCTKIDDNDPKHENYVIGCLDSKKHTNNVALGYKYYLPRGVKKIEDFDYNQKFSIDNINLYMFVDINSYYYKTDINIDSNSSDYYFQQISYDGKYGYIKIIKDNDKYYTRLVYNYARIEFYSKENQINKFLSLSAIILDSIKYNKNVIEKVLDENLGTSKEFSYDIEKPIDASSNFSQYLEEYVIEEKKEEKLPDE